MYYIYIYILYRPNIVKHFIHLSRCMHMQNFEIANNLNFRHKLHTLIESLKMLILKHFTRTKPEQSSWCSMSDWHEREVLETKHKQGKIKKHGEYTRYSPTIQAQISKKLARLELLQLLGSSPSSWLTKTIELEY